MKSDSWTNLVHLLALAGQLEREGQYSMAKLARAAADAIGRQAAYQVTVPSDWSQWAVEVVSAANTLDALGTATDLVDALRRGATALAAARLPSLAETPAPYVCRTCGLVAMDRPPATCPTCGAWAATFQHFQPVYWLDAYEPMDALAELRQTPVALATLLAGVPDAQLEQATDGWSACQSLTHLRDAQGVLVQRLSLMLAEDNPSLVSLAVFAWADQADAELPSARAIFDAYCAERQDLLARLESLPLAAWWRTGQHEEFGTVTIRQQVSYFAAHEPTHMAQISRLVRSPA